MKDVYEKIQEAVEPDIDDMVYPAVDDHVDTLVEIALDQYALQQIVIDNDLDIYSIPPTVSKEVLR